MSNSTTSLFALLTDWDIRSVGFVSAGFRSGPFGPDPAFAALTYACRVFSA